MEESYKTWLEFGKLNLALTIDASLKKVNDMSRHVFTESAKQFTILKNEEFSELQKQKELNAELQSELNAANELLAIRSKQIINAGDKILQQAIEIIPFKWNGYATLSDVISTLESLKSKES